VYWGALLDPSVLGALLDSSVLGALLYPSVLEALLMLKILRNNLNHIKLDTRGQECHTL